MWSNVAALPCPQQTNDLTAARLNVSGGGRCIGGSRILGGKWEVLYFWRFSKTCTGGKSHYVKRISRNNGSIKLSVKYVKKSRHTIYHELGNKHGIITMIMKMMTLG